MMQMNLFRKIFHQNTSTYFSVEHTFSLKKQKQIGCGHVYDMSATKRFILRLPLDLSASRIYFYCASSIHNLESKVRELQKSAAVFVQSVS